MTEQETFYPTRRLPRLERPPVPFIWSSLSPRDTQLYLEDLDLWVGWLVERYRLDRRTVPECWHEHPELIEELSALHLAWQGAFALTSSHDAPLIWHEHFANACGRIGDWVARSGCRSGAHRDRELSTHSFGERQWPRGLEVDGGARDAMPIQGSTSDT